MKPSSRTYKTEHPFNQSGDSKLLAKKRGYDEGGTVDPVGVDVAGAMIEGGGDGGSSGGSGGSGGHMVGGSSGAYSPKPMTGPCPPGSFRNNNGDCVKPVQTN